jgi:type IV pilus biogenesis protein PilP
MSSYRRPSNLTNQLLGTVAILAAFAATSALAQQAPQLPNAAARPVQAASQTPPGVLPPGVNGGKPVAAPVEKGLPPGATLSDAEQRVRAMAAENSRALDDLVSGAVTDARENNTVKTFAKRKMDIMDLDYQLDVAKRGKELWTTLNGEETEKETQIKELESKVSTLTAEKEALSKQAQAASLLARSTLSSADPDPVVAEVLGAGNSVRAEILVPYMGRFNVSTGDTLPNGQKVVSIGANGVTVMKDGERKMLAFGTSVPSTRPVRNASQMIGLSQ